MSRKIIVVFAILAAIAIYTGGCSEEKEEEVYRMDRDELFSRLSYSTEMYFYGSHGRSRWWRSVFPLDGRLLRDVYIVFVHSEEDAANFPDDVSVLWPSDITVNLVYQINQEIKREGIDVEQFSLQYPLTIENIVDDWEKARDLMWSIPSSSFSILQGHASGFFERFREQQEREATETVAGEGQNE